MGSDGGMNHLGRRERRWLFSLPPTPDYLLPGSFLLQPKLPEPQTCSSPSPAEFLLKTHCQSAQPAQPRDETAFGLRELLFLLGEGGGAEDHDAILKE